MIKRFLSSDNAYTEKQKSFTESPKKCEEKHYNFAALFLLHLDAEDVEMGNGFHDVGGKVGLDGVVATETAGTSFWLVPIGTVKDEGDELATLEGCNELEGARLVHVPLVFGMIGVVYWMQGKAAGKTSHVVEPESVGGR